MTLAERVHSANREVVVCERLMCKALVEAVGCEDWSTDDSDNSIEVFGSNVRRDEAALAAIREAGFTLAWLHLPTCEPPRGNGCKCQPVRVTEPTSAAGKP